MFRYIASSWHREIGATRYKCNMGTDDLERFDRNLPVSLHNQTIIHAPCWTQYLSLLLPFRSDYLWLLAMLMTSPLVVTLGLSLTVCFLRIDFDYNSQHDLTYTLLDSGCSDWRLRFQACRTQCAILDRSNSCHSWIPLGQHGSAVRSG
jgi:hypothetical protein